MTSKRARILIVDDMDTSIFAQKMILGSSSYECISAKDPQEALAHAETLQPDVILLDVMMPAVSGFRMAEWLKRNELTRGIPIIMVTAASELVHQSTASLYGFDDFITKPFNREELREKVRKALSRKTTETSAKAQPPLVEGVVKR